MHLFQTILDSSNDPNQLIDFSNYDLSELSTVPFSSASASLSSNCELPIASSDVQRFLENAPEIITRNLAYWYQNGIEKYVMIELKSFQTIDKLAKSTDKELALVFLSLLIHVSKYKLTTFQSVVVDIDLSLYRRANAIELPSQQVVDGALDILKKDAFVQVFTNILNARLAPESPVNTSYTKQQLGQCKIVFVHFTTRNIVINSWATANGVAINVSALSPSIYATLSHRVALASLLGHEIQHYLNRQAFENFNISAQKSMSKFPENQESGLFFEYAAFGAKFTFYKAAQPLLDKIEKKLSGHVSLPLLSENEIADPLVQRFLNPRLNAPFGFELGEDDNVYE